jgi:hypothetical protein
MNTKLSSLTAVVMAMIIVVGSIIAIPITVNIQTADAFTNRDSDGAPLAISSENVYAVWWSNETGQNQVISERI